MRRIFPVILVLGACSLLNRKGPTVTCADLGNGATNACKDGIVASCIANRVEYQVCDLASACDQGWQTKGAYRCNEKDQAPITGTDGGGPAPIGQAPDGGACGPGVPCVLANTGVSDIAIDDSNIYVNDCSNVKRIAKTGGVLTTLATGLTGCGGKGLYVDNTDIYVQDGSSGVSRVSKTGGTFAKVLPPSSVVLFAMDTADIYWTAGAVDVLKAIPKTGGTPTTLTTNTDFQGTRMLVESGFVYWLGTGTNLNRISTSGTVPTAPSSLDLTQGAADFAVDGDTVYFVTQGSPGGASGGVWSASLSSGTPKQLATEGGTAIAVDAANIYVGGARLITKLPKAGGASTTVVAMEPPIETRIVVDDTSVYWGGAGKVMRATK